MGFIGFVKFSVSACAFGSGCLIEHGQFSNPLTRTPETP